MNAENRPLSRDDDPAHDYVEETEVDWDLEDEFLDGEEAVVGVAPVDD
ncbi:MAG: hypothetical protein M3017_06130 [Actinomycetota bacterium]|nr:hypothetical protein [Actinomycetota bacterium]